MYKIAVSPEQLETFACKVEEFKKSILSECEYLQQQADSIRPFVDDTTGLALARPVKEIVGIVKDNEPSLNKVVASAYTYANAVRDIQKRLEEGRQANAVSGAAVHKNTCATDITPQHTNVNSASLESYSGSENSSVSGNLSDTSKAQAALDFVILEEKAYNQAIKEGRAVEDPVIRQQIADSKEEALRTIERVNSGGPYEEPPFYEKLKTPEWQTKLDNIFDIINTFIGGVGHPSIPDEATDAFKGLLNVLIPEVIRRGPDIAENMHNTYDTESDKFKKEFDKTFPLRDQDGNPVDAAGNRPEDVLKKNAEETKEG